MIITGGEPGDGGSKKGNQLALHHRFHEDDVDGPWAVVIGTIFVNGRCIEQRRNMVRITPISHQKSLCGERRRRKVGGLLLLRNWICSVSE